MNGTERERPRDDRRERLQLRRRAATEVRRPLEARLEALPPRARLPAKAEQDAVDAWLHRIALTADS